MRSSSTTGIFALLASLSTSSQPSLTIGAMTIASTPWLMKLRTAAICAAGSLSAALKIRSKPFALENAFFMDSVLAARQPDSEPVCANPTLIGPLAALEPEPPPEELPHPAVANAMAPTTTTPMRNFFFTPDLLDLGRPTSPAPGDCHPWPGC